MPHSLGDLVEIVRSNRRTVQFWVEAGALVPSDGTHRAGRGVHRVFHDEEVVVALVVRAVSKIHLPIGRLIRVAQAVRTQWLKNPETRRWLNKAIAGEAELFAVLDDDEFQILLLANPTIKEMRRLFSEMIERKSVDLSYKATIYLTPWLSGSHLNLETA